MLSSGSINYAKLKTNLSLTMQRLKLLEKKKTELAQRSRKEIADYLADGKIERAKIRVEHIIREDYLVEAMEIVEMYCDLLLARFSMIQQMKTLDDGLVEAISSLIWVSTRMSADVKELRTIADLLAQKYGKPFALTCKENSLKSVNERLMIKMGVQAPPKILVERYLIEIAKMMNVPYEPDHEVIEEDEKYNNSTGAALIDLNSTVQSTNFVMPPPLPLMPPAATSSGQDLMPPDLKKPPLGFINMPPIPTAPDVSVPPSYDSVVNKDEKTTFSEFNPDDLPSVPNLPDIPDDLDDSDFHQKPDGGSNVNKNVNNNNSTSSTSNQIDFDDLRKRFDELKKRK